MFRSIRFLCLIAFVAALAGAPAAEASRAAEDSRGLPRLLEADATDVLYFPAVVSDLAPQVLVDAYAGSGDYGLALGGRRVRYGYVNDDDRHNLVVGGPGGWGAILGFKDAYERQENFYRYDEDSFHRDDNENWERSLRLALGWKTETAAGRRFEVGVSGTLLQGESDAEALAVSNGNVSSIELRWKADHGLGFGIALRTLAADGGLQAAIRFDYADLQPEEEVPRFRPEVIRRAAGLDLGWRTTFGNLDDAVIGVSLAWTKDLKTVFLDSSSRPAQFLEETRYVGVVFVSLEERLREDLVARGGVHAPADFYIDKRRTFERDDEEYILGDERKTSRGSTDSPELYLGAGWTWKSLTFDARVDTYLDLSSPVVGWAASWEF